MDAKQGFFYMNKKYIGLMIFIIGFLVITLTGFLVTERIKKKNYFDSICQNLKEKMEPYAKDQGSEVIGCEIIKR